MPRGVSSVGLCPAFWCRKMLQIFTRARSDSGFFCPTIIERISRKIQHLSPPHLEFPGGRVLWHTVGICFSIEYLNKVIEGIVSTRGSWITSQIVR